MKIDEDKKKDIQPNRENKGAPNPDTTIKHLWKSLGSIFYKNVQCRVFLKKI